MRTWRVGSISMGAALVLLGVFLLLAQVLSWDPAIAMISWWPLLLIILGVEILVYLNWKKDEQQHVKYDFISIIFIGIIGTFGLGMTMLNATGLLDIASQAVSAEVRTLDLPKYEEVMTDDIKRVFVETGRYSANIEASPGKETVMFGTYRGEMRKDVAVKDVSDYALIEKQGDTLFIKLKEMPTSRLLNDGSEINATLLIPDNVKLEVVGNGNDVNIKTRNLKADWSVASMSNVKLDVPETSNVKIEAIDMQELGDETWKNVKRNEDVDKVSGNLTYGNGAHTLQIQNSYTLQIGR
ncbi:hypothetical protein [Lederbergia citrea]|uniref:DUF5668 domain-containing protein n=1 Tax=Lederbergia citrea TaxID=2833581 RepID=A0A942USW0_9BACI|nr:hypothetical protein [Lederbergia citrea]MBS4179450.1 hypothetical protein [Lederbergia citrea]MBS4206118.1 hypothetical protein [Lederbergia citrea]MBS4224433.1 hypothetical protein [Lederbergia citrea]